MPSEIGIGRRQTQREKLQAVASEITRRPFGKRLNVALDAVTIALDCQSAFIKACKDADIPHGTKTPNGITFRDIRTTVKTNMLAAGVDKVYRDKILGHSLKGMDEYYMKPSEEDLHRAMGKYTAWVDDQFAIVDQTDDQVDVATNF